MSTVYNGYYKTEYDDGITEYLAEKLNEILPHGSGIDFDWTLEYHVKAIGDSVFESLIKAYNAYHGMNDGGYYCHIWPFVVEIPVISELNTEKGSYNSGTIDWDKIDKLEISFIDCDPENDCPAQKELDEYWSQVEVDDMDEYPDNAYDNAPSGCGYGLEDYLSELVYSCFLEKRQ